MSSRLDLVDQNLSLGQVKSITTGSVLDYVELMVGDNTKAQLSYDKEKNMIAMEIKDANLDLAQLSCYMDKTTIKNLIASLKTLHNQLADTEE